MATFLMGICPYARAAERTNAPGALTVVPYLEPKILTGTISEMSDPDKVLFHFRRTATNSGASVQVLREYTLTNGTIASRERVVYNGSQLVSYDLEDLQAGTHGSVSVVADSKNPKQQKINFEFTKGSSKKTDSETLEKNTLINDMVAPFIIAHWNALTNGETIKVRLVAMSRTETVGFSIHQESRTSLNGKSVVIVRMEPSSLLISQFVDPLFFTIETDEPHRIYKYTGRTTPSISKNGKWQDLDALTTFDW